jgi:phosphomannomutase
MAEIFKAYDVRGVYERDLDEKDAYLIGYYFVKYLGLDELKVSHDCRLSSNSLCKFFIKGLLDASCRPIYQGLSSTPNFYYSLFEGVSSGVMITASHNSKEYNGFKFMNNLESFDSRNGLKEIEKLVLEDKDKRADNFLDIEKEIKGLSLVVFLQKEKVETSLKLNEYVNCLEDYYNMNLDGDEKKALENVKIGFDFSSGVSSLALVPFLKKIGLNCVFLNDQLDGNFLVHAPDPTKAGEFLEGKKDLGVDLFMVFDGDGDRVVFYDENSKQVLPDYPMALLIDYFSENSDKFVVDLRASRIISDICDEKKVKLDLLRVGRSFYQDFMRENDVMFGGELSGHLFFKDFKYLDNPDFAVIYMLKIIAREILNNGSFSFLKLVEKYKKYYKIPETNMVVDDATKVLDSLKDEYGEYLILKLDGYSFDCESFWFNVRKSNTEPKIRITFEGYEEVQTKEEFDKLIEFIKGV